MPDRDAQFIKDITHLLEIQVSSSTTSEKVQHTINLFQYILTYEFLKECVHGSPLFYNQIIDKSYEIINHENCTPELQALCEEVLVRIN
jgi:hypothetical protein